MIKINYLTRFISCSLLLVSSCVALASDIDSTEKNTSLTNSRVPSQFLPIEKSTVGDSTSYTFIDKQSVKIHPYNNLIKTYTRVINYDPALLQENDGETVPYRSMVINEYVNCDKKEFAKGLIQTYENYFGEGKLQSNNDKPKRWEATAKNSKERQNLIVVCGLSVVNY